MNAAVEPTPYDIIAPAPPPYQLGLWPWLLLAVVALLLLWRLKRPRAPLLAAAAPDKALLAALTKPGSYSETQLIGTTQMLKRYLSRKTGRELISLSPGELRALRQEVLGAPGATPEPQAAALADILELVLQIEGDKYRPSAQANPDIREQLKAAVLRFQAYASRGMP